MRGNRLVARDLAGGRLDPGPHYRRASHGGRRAQADGSLRPEPQIQVADMARTVRDMASLPLDANVATCPP
jgi:hypothetical protein